MDLLFTILPFAIVLYCVYSIYRAVCIGTKKRTTRITRTGLSKNNVNECWFWTKAKP